ncbi:MAG: DUF4405 domain-containing protein [Candidatus Diapherotrites archaeon]
MGDTKINYVIDILLIILFLVVAISGIILFLFLPRGAGRQGINNFFGIERHVLADLHNWVGLIFTLIMLVHIVLHLRWLCEMSKCYLKLK